MNHCLSIYIPQLLLKILTEVGTFCFFLFTLMANTPWDPSQAYFHLHETEEEEEVN